jgi:N-formylglutamate deformylase
MTPGPSIAKPSEPFRILPPTASPCALVLDSPHSSRHFPADFGHAVSEVELREAEDTDIDDLYGDAPSQGATLLLAGFARTYADPNRHAGDVDLELLDGDWPFEHVPSGKARIGKALIWRTLEDGRPIYPTRLTVDAVRHRIDHYVLPYQRTLARLIDEAHARHGVCFHINCHSMAAGAGRMGEGGEGAARADIVLGDRDGTTCSPEFTERVRDFFASAGYAVRINDPYKGVELVRAFSDPSAGRHSLQVEINKRLYLDGRTFTRSPGYPVLKRDLGRLVAVLADHAREHSR